MKFQIGKRRKLVDGMVQYQCNAMHIDEIPMQVRHYQQLAGRREDELGVLRGEVSF